MILCVAGDPGGSRAVLPVAEELWRQGKTVIIPRHGTLAQELPTFMGESTCEEEEAFALLPQCEALVFGSSTNDTYPLSLARAAQAQGTVVMHVLDNWGSYQHRLCSDSLPPLAPDIYTVIDEESRRDAEREGVPAASLVITGQPGLAAVADALENRLRSRKKSTTHKNERLNLGFISEPFAMVFGRDCQIEGHPGFTEETVLASLCKNLAPHAGTCTLSLLPHPKQRVEDVTQLWERVRGPLEGEVLSLPRGRDILPMVSGVVGMASILLYEAWLGGIPVLSMQPNCQWPSLRRFASLEGINYACTDENITNAVGAWLAQSRVAVPSPRPELFLHKNAPQKAAEILLQRMRNAL